MPEKRNADKSHAFDSQISDENSPSPSTAQELAIGGTAETSNHSFKDAAKVFQLLKKISILSFIPLGVLWMELRSHPATIGKFLYVLSLLDLLIFIPASTWAGRIFGLPELQKHPLRPLPIRLLFDIMVARFLETWSVRVRAIIHSRKTLKGQWIIIFSKWFSAAFLAVLAWSFDFDGAKFNSLKTGSLTPLLYAPVGISFLISLLAHLMPAVLVSALVARVGPWRVALAISVPVGVLTALGFIFGGVKLVDQAAHGALTADAPLATLGSYSLVGGLLGLLIGCMQAIVDISATKFIPTHDKSKLEAWYSRICELKRSINDRFISLLALAICGAASMLTVWIASPHLRRFGDAKVLAVSLAPAYSDRVISIARHDNPELSPAEIRTLSQYYAQTLSQLAPSRHVSMCCALALLFLVFLYVIGGLIWDLLASLAPQSTPSVARTGWDDREIFLNTNPDGVGRITPKRRH